MTDDRLIILEPQDTIAVARCAISQDETLTIGGDEIVLKTAVSMGHKLAICPMKKGDKVLKYGVSIGSATHPIAIGDHVHMHNMKSDYTPTYALSEEGKVM